MCQPQASRSPDRSLLHARKYFSTMFRGTHCTIWELELNKSGSFDFASGKGNYREGNTGRAKWCNEDG